MKPDVRQSVRLIAVLSMVGLVIALTSIALLYNISVHQQGLRLRGMVRNYARMIETIAAHEEHRTHAASLPAEQSDVYQTVLNLLHEAQQEFDGFGRTGELKVGRLEGDSVVYLAAHRGDSATHPLPVPAGGDRGQSMHRAASGLSGVGVLIDYSGVRVLAAYEPVEVFDLGVVAKIDLAEIQVPFVRAGLLALAATLLFVAGGGLLLLVVTAPERRRLRETEERFRLAFEHADIGMSLTALDGRLLRVNQAYAKMLDRTVEELHSTDFMHITHPDDVAESAELVRSTVAGERAGFKIDRRYVHKDGSIVWTHVVSVLQRDANGRPAYLITQIQNITLRKRAEEEVARAKRRLEYLVESSPIVIYTSKVSGDYGATYMSGNVVELTGFGLSDFLDDPGFWLDHIHPEDRDRVMADLPQMFKQPSYAHEYRFRKKDGDYIWVRDELRVLRDAQGQPIEVVGSWSDITERKRAEQGLRENEERFRLLVHQASDGIYVHELSEDQSGRFLEVNDSICRMLGYSREEMLAMDVNDIRAPGSLAPMPEAISELRARGSLVFATENRTKDGRTLPFEVNARLFDLQGRTVVLAIARDITERKQAEEEKERLAREVDRRKVELERLIYVASHDLRTPLVGVQGFVGEVKLSLRDLLAELNRPDVPPEFRNRITEMASTDIPESLKFIDAGVARMSVLLSGLLRLSRLGRAAFRAEPLDMNRVVGEVVRSLEFAAREAGAEVEVSDLPPSVGDPMQVGQVFSNLIENALKYRSPDRSPVVRISGRREGNTAVYCVEDNGVGIAAELRERVFEPFYRAVPGGGGEGLGLTIVTRILERLGGRVWVESELGKGSRFYVALPTG